MSTNIHFYDKYNVMYAKILYIRISNAKINYPSPKQDCNISSTQIKVNTHERLKRHARIVVNHQYSYTE